MRRPCIPPLPALLPGQMGHEIQSACFGLIEAAMQGSRELDLLAATRAKQDAFRVELRRHPFRQEDHDVRLPELVGPPPAPRQVQWKAGATGRGFAAGKQTLQEPEHRALPCRTVIISTPPIYP